MKIVRMCLVILATLTFVSVAAAQCGPARPKAAAGTGSLDEMIVAQEKLIIDAIKKRDVETFKSLVDVNGTVVNSSGIKKILDAIPELFSADVSISEYTLEEPQVRTVDKNTAIINYKSSSTATYLGKTITSKSFETTVFVRRAAKWVAWFHQSSEMASVETTGKSDK